jgi:integrase
MTSRRADGEGSLYQLSNGKWKGSVSVGYTVSGKRVRKTVTAPTKKLAAKRLVELKATWVKTSVLDRDWTVQEWCDNWLEVIAPQRAAPHTVANYRSNLVRFVYPRLGAINLVRLSARHIAELQDQLVLSNLKVSSVKVARRPLSVALNEAVRRGVLNANPVQAVRLPKDTRFGPVGTRLTKSQTEAMIMASHNASPHVGLFVLLGVVRGLRRGEICGLWWDDIDYEKAEIHITHNLIESSTYGIDGTPVTELVRKDPKSFTSRRTLTLSADLERAFKRVKTQQARDRLKSPAPWPEEPYVFANRFGGPIWPTNLARSFRRFLKTNDLLDIGAHDLRRTFANTASQAGAPIEQISEALGHASIGITKSLYIGQVPVLATRAFDAVDDYLNPASNTPRIAGQP